MFKGLIKFASVLTALVFIFAGSPGLAANANSNIGVGFTINSSGGGGGGGGGGGVIDNPPTIINVVVATTTNSANISWSAHDDFSLSSVTFDYGTTVNYGTPGTVVNQSSTSLTGLNSGTQYFFKISATDGASHLTTYTGTFTTGGSVIVPPPPPPPPPPPSLTISNISVTPSQTGAVITWQTSATADSQVVYGATSQYGSTIVDQSLVTSHTITLAGLDPNTLHHYLITSTDGDGNQASSNDGTFTTLKDNVAPPDVQNFGATPSSNAINLSWVNPNVNFSVPDFSGVVIVRKAGVNHPTSRNDGTVVYTGAGSAFSDTGLLANTAYSYAAFSFDTSFNYSGGVFVDNVSLAPGQNPTEICNNNIDDDHNGLTDCLDSACFNSSFCSGNGPTPAAEICNNNLDDDNNGFTDCADSACSGFSACKNSPNNPDVPTPTPIPAGNIGGTAKVQINQISFSAGQRQIALQPQNSIITLPAGSTLTATVPGSALFKKPESIELIIGANDRHQFFYNVSEDKYYSDVTMPPLGTYAGYIQINYSSTQNDVVAVTLNSLAWGDVLSASARLSGANIELYNEGGQLMPLSAFGEANPFVTNINGNYVFVVPNGRYFIKASKSGFYTRTTPVFTVSNNTVNQTLELIATPPSIASVIDSKKPVLTNVAAVAKNLGERASVVTQVITQTIDDARNNQTVQKTTAVVVPTVVGVAAVGVASAVSLADVLPVLRLLFLQPLVLLGRRRREKWGQVYNALTKLPIDLVTMRLISAETGRVVQTKVTDSKGRFAFIAEPGTYRIEAIKDAMQFPSALLKDFKDDGRKPDIYHGEVINVTEKNAMITVNVPLDPMGDPSKPVRLHIARITKIFQNFLAVSGFLITLASFIISPKWYIGLLLAGHLLLLIVFRRLARPPKIKSWGIVYEDQTKKPIGRAVARLFNASLNKLVGTQITDSRGRYYFLAGDNRYYVTYEHPNYQPYQIEPIDLSGKEAETITADVALKKK